MASYTPNLNLLKKSPVTDGNDTFNVDTMLNDNWDKIDDAVSNVFPTGSIIWFSGKNAPNGFLICDGSSFEPSTYKELYSVLGVSNLPDLIGKFIKGSKTVMTVNQGTYVETYNDRSTYTVSASVGGAISSSTSYKIKYQRYPLGPDDGPTSQKYYVQPPNVTMLPCIKY